MDFVTVHKTRDPIDAELVKNQLEQAEIGAFIPEANSPMPVLSGVRVQVAEADKDRAMEVLGLDELPK
ncbi:MAG: hypothetical protein CMO80_10115 [Verrucomicrobiales bacterium]|nr:hypothetical protein [Verrucomicrobiales bacterium]|tara:strand:- start:545 stop:748 length:204 start_codon:yes stop_codon:yes gene_type:complete